MYIPLLSASAERIYIQSTYNPLLSASADRPIVMLASWTLGVLMYIRNAELCQHPKPWIMESLIPAQAAMVAAPILKL